MPSKAAGLIGRLTLQVVAPARIDRSPKCCYNLHKLYGQRLGKRQVAGRASPRESPRVKRRWTHPDEIPSGAVRERACAATKRYRRLPLSSLAPYGAAEVAHREVRDEHGWHHESRRFSSYRARSALLVHQVQRRNR